MANEIKYTPATTNAPKDLKVDAQVTINNVAKKLILSASWSTGDDNYDGGQQFYWKRSGLPTKPTDKYWGTLDLEYAKGHNTSKISTSATSITFAELNLTSFHPVRNRNDKHDYLRWIRVRVRGQKGKYKKTKKVKTKNGKTTTKDTWYDPTWSNYATRIVNIEKPPKPVMSDPAAGASDIEKIFSWTVPATSSWAGVDSKKSKYDMEKFEVFYDTQWQTILVNNNGKAASVSYGKDAWKEGHLGWGSGSTTAGDTSGTVTITETPTAWAGNYSFTRYVRVRSRGPAGDSEWVEAKFTYSNNPAPSTNPKPNTSENPSGGYTLTVGNYEPNNPAYPVSYYSVQHSVSIPITSITTSTPSSGKTVGTVSISAPPENDASWVEDKRINSRGVFSFPLDSFTEEDKMIWARLVAVYGDNQQAKGAAQRAMGKRTARLPNPTGLSVSNIVTATHRVTVSATNNSQVAASYLVIYYRTSHDEDTKTAVDILPHGETSKVVQLPDWGNSEIDIGVQALLASYTATTDSSGKKKYVFSPIYMESDIVWDGGSMPLPPTDLKLSLTDKIGTIRATWTWTWTYADAAEISWSDHEDAWESTDQPSTYVITNTYNGQWNIAGLSVGDWWVRVRFLKYQDDTTTYGMYSEPAHIKIVSVPERPYLAITPSLITPDEQVTLSWVYSSEDGAPQSKADVALSNNLTQIVKSANDGETTLTISKTDQVSGQNWWNGEVKLKLQLTSEENQVSDWSQEASFRIAPKPVIPNLANFNASWVPNASVTIDEMTIPKNCLVAMPLSFDITNIPANNEVTVSIKRKSGNIVRRPDENDYPVYAGDVAYLHTEQAKGGSISISIEQSSLTEDLEDGHDYLLDVVNKDPYGQATSLANPIEFRVAWTHQAQEPSAEITIDNENYIAYISPIRPVSDYSNGDVCDIYRLSIDKPQLVYRGAPMSATTSNNTIVDPYPTIGDFGGYKIVYRTLNGDYRLTTDSKSGYAFKDYDEADHILDAFVSIIDFGADKVVLRYDLSLSHSWKKDFTETKYLGGSIQGDWNPGVSRTGTVKATVSIYEDPFVDDPGSTVEAMRRLAVYSGICHVRTPDGSNYYANVDVQEDREEKWVTDLAKFNLSITRVDPPSSDGEGYTLADWNNED